MRVAYSDDGTRIVTGAADGAVSLWDAETLQASRYGGGAERG